MADIVELERRISAALNRISEGLDRRASRSAHTAEVEALTARLEEALRVNADLEAQLQALTEAAGQAPAAAPEAEPAADDRIAALTLQVDTLGAEVARLRKTSAALREALAVLTTAEVVDGEAVNRALLAELEALRAERAAETAELAAIMAELEPLTAAAGTED